MFMTHDFHKVTPDSAEIVSLLVDNFVENVDFSFGE